MKRYLMPLLLFQLLFMTVAAQTIFPLKLFRFGNAENEKPAVLTADGKKLNVAAFGENYNEEFFATNGIERLEKWVAKNISECPAVPADARIASCVARPSKIVAI